MSTTHIFIDKRNRCVMTVPAFLRDMFHFANGEEVEITTNGEQIIITPKKKSRSEQELSDIVFDYHMRQKRYQ